MLSPKGRYYLAWVILIGSVIAWPLTALTCFRNEPQGILGLSWCAIIITAFDVLCTSDVRKQQEDREDRKP